MTFARRALLTVLTTLALATAAPGTFAEGHRHATMQVGHVLVIGKVVQKLNLATADLALLPQHTVTVTYKAGSGEQTHTFTGPTLLDVLNLAKPDFNPDIKNDKVRHYVTATASDGYQGLIAWGEIDLELEAKQILVAIIEDGVSLEDVGPTLVVPGDIRGSRYVSGITSLRLAAGPRRSQP